MSASTLTEADIADLRNLMAAPAPGGWIIARGIGGSHLPSIRGGDRARSIQAFGVVDDATALAIVELHNAAPTLLAEITRLRATLAESEATLANERGEGEPPSEGWAWITSSKVRHGWRSASSSVLPYHPKPLQPRRLWAWTYMPLVGECLTGMEPTARAAMRAADTARGPK